MEHSNTLKEVRPGECAMIVSVGKIAGPVRRRLIDMGLTPGAVVTVRKVAPLGDPIEITVRGYTLTLRKEEAAQIIVGTPAAREAVSKKQGAYYTPRRLDPETRRRMELFHAHEASEHASVYDEHVHDSREMKIALAGNPNSGKTTLFNALTGSDQYVGNWPGVTVEKKEGKAKVDGKPVTIVDLPGIYSLSPYSIEEIVARDFIIGEKPDAIINIIDATNFERNMYLTIQLLELERPMVVALNFMDEIEKRGDKIDIQMLSEKLGIPVVPIAAKTGYNLDKLLEVAHRQMHEGYTIEPDDLYDDFTHEIHHRIGEMIHDKAYAKDLPAHWASIKLIEGDRIVEEALCLSQEEQESLGQVITEYEASSPIADRETLIADSRYRYIEGVRDACYCRGDMQESISDRIDRVVTHKFFAIPLFLLAMFCMFSLTFGPLGSVLSDGIGAFVDERFGVWLAAFLESVHTAPWLISLCVEGVLAGVGGVLTFLPQIALLFFFLSLLEDSGYMARAAFIMDRLLKRFGLSGKAFIPMLMGFGCTVPAVMGARTMESEKDRRMTIMLVPFMSCSAKLPIYGLIASAFFGAKAGVIVFSLYVIGMLCAVGTGILFKNTLFRGVDAPFVLELPPYRMPSMKNVCKRVWLKVADFLTRAGTLIFLMSIVLWILKTFDFHMQMVTDESVSMLGQLGNKIAPVFTPLGFGTWQAAVALLTGVIAKEAVVASLSMFYGFSLTAESGVVAAALSSTFVSPISAFSFLIFCLLYVPCVAAVSAIYREMNSLKWTVISVAWQMLTAYVVSFVVFQFGRFLGF